MSRVFLFFDNQPINYIPKFASAGIYRGLQPGIYPLSISSCRYRNWYKIDRYNPTTFTNQKTKPGKILPGMYYFLDY